jgi:hypothetical protein
MSEKKPNHHLSILVKLRSVSSPRLHVLIGVMEAERKIEKPAYCPG